MENISYVSFLGEGHEVLDSQDLQKPIFGLGWGFSSCSVVGHFFFTHSLIHSIDRCSHLSSCSHSIHSFTYSSHLIRELFGEGNQIAEKIHSRWLYRLLVYFQPGVGAYMSVMPWPMFQLTHRCES
jgi:hypothetical protein